MVRVAVAGHRARHRLAPEREVTAALARAFRDIRRRAGGRRLVLLTGGAEGTDFFARRVWRAMRLGEIALRLSPTDRAVGGRRFASYAAQSRALTQEADILVVVWDGKAARGPGGVAETVERMLAAERSVLWLPADAPAGARWLASAPL